jgi:hypothetical protein
MFEGKETWNGKWSEKCSKTRIVRKKLDKKFYQENRNGLFWMSFDDFFHHFCFVWVCEVSKHWIRKQYTSEFPKIAREKSTAFSFKVKKRVKESSSNTSNLINIGLFHSNKQNIHTDLNILALKKDTRSSSYSLFAFNQGKIAGHVDIEAWYPEGEYLILPVSFKHKLAQFGMLDSSYNLVLHVTREIDVKRVELEPEIVDGYICEMVKSYYLEYPIDNYLKVYLNQPHNLFMWIVENKNPYCRYRVNFRYKPGITRDNLYTSTSSFNEFSRYIEPNGTQIAFYCLTADTSLNAYVGAEWQAYYCC